MIKKFCEFIKEGWTTTTTDEVSSNESDVIKFLKIVENWEDSRDERKLKAAFGSAKGLFIGGNASKFSPIINRILGDSSIYVNEATVMGKNFAKFAEKYRGEILIFDKLPVFESDGAVSILKDVLDNTNAFIVINTDKTYKELKDDFSDIASRVYAV